MHCFHRIFLCIFCWFFLCSFESHSIQKILDYSHSGFFQNHVLQCIRIANQKGYLYHIKKTLYYSGLPEKLAYLPVIESCYDENAVSNRGAVGMWQINKITAVHLNMDMQERYDWKKSTSAITDYFHFLIARLPNWPLILAAYNVGPTYVRDEIDHNNTIVFEHLRLPNETKKYVYQYYAMINIINRKRISQ